MSTELLIRFSIPLLGLAHVTPRVQWFVWPAAFAFVFGCGKALDAHFSEGERR